MDRLPAELIDAILQESSITDVCNLAATNRRWHQQCLHRIYYFPKLNNAKQHDLFFKSTNYHTQMYIRHLNLEPSLITNEQLERLTGCTGLISLQLSHCAHISSDVLDKVLRSCVASVQRVYLADGKLAQSTLQLLGQASRYFHLRTLDLSNTMIRPCDRIDTPHHLESMIMNINEDANNDFTTANSGDDKNNTLHDLNLSYCSWVDDTTLLNVTFGLPFLKFINLRFCHHLSAMAIMKMIRHLRYISTIDVCHVPCMNEPSCVHNLLSLNPLLEKINFTHHFKPSLLIRSPQI
ncbi:hypothetical protein BCR42DRAFT_446333 [Absidia repens]|uniref:F-box domain-containing protein n=1 Tax=Absidia repens TaxID=90262 RepID=A0A1X2J083_9FUNG|nr:hypothetical protein BCR42DRAFT_446333 [Absidia repens]